MFVWNCCCYVKTPCNFCSCSWRFTASCASFCIVSNFSSVTDFMGIILGLQRTGIGVCSVKRRPCFGRTSLKTSLSPAILSSFGEAADQTLPRDSCPLGNWSKLLYEPTFGVGWVVLKDTTYLQTLPTTFYWLLNFRWHRNIQLARVDIARQTRKVRYESQCNFLLLDRGVAML